jgi:hypothetical protein
MSSIIRATTTSGLQIAPDNSGSLQLQTNGTTTAVTIDTSQNVGIGTTSPTNKLTIGGTNSNIFFKNADATTGYAAGQIVNTGGSFYFGLTSSTGAFWANTAGNYAATIGTSNATNLSFATNDNVRMVIDSSGNVLVGTTSAVASSKVVAIANTGGNSFGCWAQATTGNNGFITFGTENTYTERGYIYYNRGAGQTQLSATSDYRAKVIDGKTQNALAKISAIQVHDAKLKWAEGASYPMFIAHELQEVAPWAVTGEKDAVDENNNPKYQVVAYESLVATLTAAIQEQQTIINDLKARVETLEAKLG